MINLIHNYNENKKIKYLYLNIGKLEDGLDIHLSFKLSVHEFKSHLIENE